MRLAGDALGARVTVSALASADQERLAEIRKKGAPDPQSIEAALHSHVQHATQASQDLKQHGNTEFKAGNLETAVERYTEGLEHCSDKSLHAKVKAELLANRSEAWLKLELWSSARDDAEAALAIIDASGPPHDTKLQSKCRARLERALAGMQGGERAESKKLQLSRRCQELEAQAEAAAGNKDFKGADQLFTKALKKLPTWDVDSRVRLLRSHVDTLCRTSAGLQRAQARTIEIISLIENKLQCLEASEPSDVIKRGEALMAEIPGSPNKPAKWNHLHHIQETRAWHEAKNVLIASIFQLARLQFAFAVTDDEYQEVDATIKRADMHYNAFQVVMRRVGHKTGAEKRTNNELARLRSTIDELMSDCCVDCDRVLTSARNLLRVGKYDQVVHHLETVREDEDWQVEHRKVAPELQAQYLFVEADALFKLGQQSTTEAFDDHGSRLKGARDDEVLQLYHRGLVQIERAIVLDAGNWSLWRLKGLLLCELHEHEEGIKALEHVLVLQPPQGDIKLIRENIQIARHKSSFGFGLPASADPDGHIMVGKDDLAALADKDRGNELFAAKAYDEAVVAYTAGLMKLAQYDMNNCNRLLRCTLLSNRAECYLRTQIFDRAHADVESALPDLVDQHWPNASEEHKTAQQLALIKLQKRRVRACVGQKKLNSNVDSAGMTVQQKAEECSRLYEAGLTQFRRLTHHEAYTLFGQAKQLAPPGSEMAANLCGYISEVCLRLGLWRCGGSAAQEAIQHADGQNQSLREAITGANQTRIARAKLQHDKNPAAAEMVAGFYKYRQRAEEMLSENNRLGQSGSSAAVHRKASALFEEGVQLIPSEEVRSRAEFLFLRSKLMDVAITEEQGMHWDAAAGRAQLARAEEAILADPTFYGGYFIKAETFFCIQQMRGAISAAKEALNCDSIPSDYASQMEQRISIGTMMKNSGMAGRNAAEQAILEKTCCVCHKIADAPKSSGGSSKKKKKKKKAQSTMRKCEGCAKSPDSPRYCSLACQKQDWKEHKKACSQDTPSKKQNLESQLS